MLKFALAALHLNVIPVRKDIKMETFACNGTKLNERERRRL